MNLNNERGILTIAHGDAKFARQAVALARSIRLRDPHLPLAVATDLDASLFEGMFDSVIPFDFALWPGYSSKLAAYEVSPFQTTLFIDSDCLALESLVGVFEFFRGQSFGVFGSNLSEDYRFVSMEAVRVRIPSATYPSFNGGLYFYEKSEMAKAVFDCARDFMPDYDALQLRRLNNIINEEPLISVAMAKFGLKASDDGSIVPISVPHLAYFDNDVDVLKGRGSLMWNGRRVQPVLMHFSGVKSRRYPYVRETLRLEEAFRSPHRRVRSEVWTSVRAMFIWLVPRIRRRIRSLMRI